MTVSFNSFGLILIKLVNQKNVMFGIASIFYTRAQKLRSNQDVEGRLVKGH